MNRVDLYVSTLNSDNTKKCYRRDIIAMLDFVDKKEENINIADMLVWKESLSNQSSATIARKIAAVKMYFRFLHMNKIIEDDQWMQMLRTRNQLAHDYDGTFAAEKFTEIINVYYPLFVKLQKNVEKYYKE